MNSKGLFAELGWQTLSAAEDTHAGASVLRTRRDTMVSNKTVFSKLNPPLQTRTTAQNQ